MPDLKTSLEIDLKAGASRPAGAIADSMRDLAQRLARGRDALGRLEGQAARLRRFNDLGDSVKQAAKRMEDARAKASELGKELAAAEEPVRSLEQRLADATRESEDAERAHSNLEVALKAERRQLAATGIETRDLGAAQRRLAGDIEQATRRIRQGEKALKGLSERQAGLKGQLARGARLSLIGDAASDFGGRAFGAFADPVRLARLVERSKGELKSLGLDPEGVTTVADKGREAMREMPGLNVDEFISAAYDIKSGISALNASGVADATELAALTARATKGGVAEMTSLFATGHGVFKSLHKDLGDTEFFERFSAQLSASVEAFKTDGSKMSQAIESMGSGLATSGVSMAEQFAALGLLQQKMGAGEAGTALKSVQENAAKAQEEFAKMNVRVRTLDAAGNMLAPSKLLAELRGAFGDELTTAELAVIQKAFGSSEAVRFISALWEQQDALAGNVRQLEAAALQGRAYTKAMQERRDDNADARLELMQQRWTELQSRIGDALLPTLESVAGLLTPVAEGFGAILEASPGARRMVVLAGGVGAIAAVTGPAIMAFAALSWAIRTVGVAADVARGKIARHRLPGAGEPGRGGPSKSDSKASRANSDASRTAGRLRRTMNRKRPQRGGSPSAPRRESGRGTRLGQALEKLRERAGAGRKARGGGRIARGFSKIGKAGVAGTAFTALSMAATLFGRGAFGEGEGGGHRPGRGRAGGSPRGRGDRKRHTRTRHGGRRTDRRHDRRHRGRRDRREGDSAFSRRGGR